MEIEKLQSAIEAILFTMGDSVEISKLAFAIGHDEETTKKLVRNMMERYEKEDRGIRIIELEDSFQLCTKKEMYEYLIRVAKQPKRYALTDVLLETLSIVAYKQPVTKLEIEKIRGVKSDHAVNKLVEYGLISYAVMILLNFLRDGKIGCPRKTSFVWNNRRVSSSVQRAVVR